MSFAPLVSAREARDLVTEQGAVLLATDVARGHIHGADLAHGLNGDLVAKRHSRSDGQRVASITGAQAGPIGLFSSEATASHLAA